MKRTKSQPPMLIEERRQHILSLIQKHGRVLVDELSTDLASRRSPYEKISIICSPKTSW